MALNPRILKAGLGLLAVCLAAYILGPSLYWQFKEGLASVKRSSSSSSASPYTTSSAISCPPCHCDCSAQSLPSIPQGLSNNSFADCAKHDPDVNEDTEKNFVELLSEELKLREAEALDNQQRADMQLLEAKKMTSQYQKEADKCNNGMETCEAAREKSEAALAAQKAVTAMWEMRARQKGWKEGAAKSHTQENVQAM